MTSNIGLNSSIGSCFNQLRVSKSITPRVDVNSAPLQNKKSDIARNLLGNTIGFAVGIISPFVVLYDNFSKKTADSLKYSSGSISELLPDVDTLENTKQTAQKILEESGLDKKGVTLNFVDSSDESQKALKEILDDAIPPKNFIKKRLNKNLFNIFSEGANAAYINGKAKKSVIVPAKQLFSNVYHELGHAMNFNGNVLSKSLMMARNMTPFGASTVAPVALLTALLHKKDKTKPNQNKNITEKVLDFISNNATGLTAISVVPLVAEEGLASIRGLMSASKHLPKETVSKLSKNYAKAWSTYAILATGTILGVWAGQKIADVIKNKKVS